MQEDRDHGMQHHEFGCPALPREAVQALLNLSAEAKGHRAAAVTGQCRPATIGRKVELRRQRAQRTSPVRQMAGQGTAHIGRLAERTPLPQGEVGVPHGRFRPFRGPAVQPGRIRQRQVTRQHRHGQSVAGDVMDHQYKRAPLCGSAQQPPPNRRLGLYVERIADRVPQRGVELGVADGVHQQPLRGLRSVQHSLPQLTVHHLNHRAQHPVPGDHVVQCQGQGLGVNRAFELEDNRDVVHRAGAVEPVQRPEPRLGIGSGKVLLGSGQHLNRRRFRVPTVCFQQPCQCAWARCLEQIPDRQLAPQLPVDAGDQADGEQRCPPVVEEPVIRCHRAIPQHLLEQGTQ